MTIMNNRLPAVCFTVLMLLTLALTNAASAQERMPTAGVNTNVATDTVKPPANAALNLDTDVVSKQISVELPADNQRQALSNQPNVFVNTMLDGENRPHFSGSIEVGIGRGTQRVPNYGNPGTVECQPPSTTTTTPTTTTGRHCP